MFTTSWYHEQRDNIKKQFRTHKITRNVITVNMYGVVVVILKTYYKADLNDLLMVLNQIKRKRDSDAL